MVITSLGNLMLVRDGSQGSHIKDNEEGTDGCEIGQSTNK